MIDDDPAPAGRGHPRRLEDLPLPAGPHGTAVGVVPRRRRPARSGSARRSRPASSRARACRSTPSRRNDFSYWELINDVVQTEPVEARRPRDGSGLLAVDRDRQGQAVRARRPDAQDPRATRSPSATPPPARWRSTPRRTEGWALLRRTRRGSTCCRRRVRVPQPATARSLRTGSSRPRATAPASSTPASRSSTPHTGITPAMCMRLTGIGSQYICRQRDADGEPLDGAQTYRITLPAGHPRSAGSGR